MNTADSAYDTLQVYYGDLHNHCGISYAHGTLDDAYDNAQLQLDFASVTGHAAWPDMAEKPMPDEVVEYHRNGFNKLRDNWQTYLERTEQRNRPGSFVTFFGYEMHSFRHGDRTFVSPLPLPAADPEVSIEEFERLLRETSAKDSQMLLLPHHIGYSTGFRGINWPSVTDDASPVIEILSMHGLAESNDPLFPYLHTMGPLDPRNTMVSGLRQGHHFGVVASTDHHSAHPGSYGYGRTAVWAEDLSRESIWKAILERRTYAVSGDRISLKFSVSGHPMGSIIATSEAPRDVFVDVVAGHRISRIDVVKNGELFHSHVPAGSTARRDSASLKGKLLLEFGWGEKNRQKHWDVTVGVEDGEVLSVEPRLRGRDVVDPLDTVEESCQFSSVKVADSTVHLKTRTQGNSTTRTSQTQALCLEIEGDAASSVNIRADGQQWSYALGTLLDEAQVIYTEGFVSPAIRVHEFIPEREYTASFSCTDTATETEDWYYVRVIQENGQCAWSSPVWMTQRR
ncbi:MAG: DUF3604 domain-containing protein [Spirochaetaceae bacterium]